MAIADELGDRQDLMAPLSDSGMVTSPIQNAIQSAIALWEDEPFYFNEVYDVGAFNTIAGQEYYTTTNVPAFATITKISKIRVIINNNRYTVTARTWQYLEDLSVNPSVISEFPVDFAYFAGQMRFYPIPAQSIPVTIMGNTRLSALVNDNDSNAWTTDGYDLIRSQAKLILAQEVLFDDDLAQRMTTAIHGDAGRGYLYKLKAATTRRAPGRIKPSYF